ncbi:hypothetical protein JCM11641_000007 [Rhodosporidiobolus odoratus]
MSLVSSQIDDYLVASFPLPLQPSSSTLPTLPSPPVSAVHYTNSSRQDSRLAVATPRVGVSIYDLADQTPLSSITVGPSFAPTTAAVSRSTPSSSSDSLRVRSARRTWIGIRTEEGKGEIWCWHEEEKKDGSTEGGEAGKAVWPISEPLAALAAPRTLPSHIAFLSASGALALAPSDNLTSLASLSPSGSDESASPTFRLISQTLRLLPASSTSHPSFLPSSLAALLPPTSTSEAHVAVIARTYATSAPAVDAGEAASSLVEIGKKNFKKGPRPSASAVIDAADASSAAATPVTEGRRNEIELVLLDPKVSLPEELEARLGLCSLGKIAVDGDQVVVSDDGFVTSLSSDGTLSSSRLSISTLPTIDAYSSLFFPIAPSEEAPSLSLAPIKTLRLSSNSLTPAHSVLLALHSSFILLASPRPSIASESTSPVVTATLWDARFGSAIATTDLTVPSAVASSLDALSLSVSLPAKHTAIVTLSPTSPSSTSSNGSRTALFAIPLSTLPTSSVLAAVVGKHTLTARFLASHSSSSTSTPNSNSSSSQAILAHAKRAEPMRSLRPGALSDKKIALLDASKDARERLLDTLVGVLEPLSRRGKGAEGEQEKAVIEAERLWEEYIEGERERLWEYNKDKVRERREKEQARRVAVLKGEKAEEAEEDGEAEGKTKYLAAKRKIERALKAVGVSVTPAEHGGEQGEGEEEKEKEGQMSWKEVVGVRIKGVSDAHRYRYERERNKREVELGRTAREFDVEEAVKKVERYEPSLPSAFVTALFRLSFPIPLDAPSSSTSTDLAVPGSSATATGTQTFRHPTKIVNYLLNRELVGDNQVLGGVTRYLARAGDWTNILPALRTMPDIPESTTVSLLVSVLRSSAAPTSAPSDSMDLDAPSSASASLPQPPPSLSTFLPAFLAQPSTPSHLRAQLQLQLSPAEAVPVLEQCDQWLTAWLRAQSGSAGEQGGKKEKKSLGVKAVPVPRDVFKLRAEGVPEMDLIIPFLQTLLDAHFVPLLLLRQSHPLLRRLSRHISAHTQLVTDLSSLVGALSVYSRKREEMRLASVVAAAAAANLAAEEEKKKNKKAVSGKGKKGKKDEGEGEKENRGAGAGSATVKELGENMLRRIKAQEKHAEVGQYEIDSFVL